MTPQNLALATSETLHSEIIDLIKTERKISVRIIHLLREIDRRRIWAEKSYSTLFEYCTKGLGYSESQAYRRISALKLVREIPEVETKLLDGSLNLTTVSQAQTYFRHESRFAQRQVPTHEKRALLSAIEGMSQKEVACEIAKKFPISHIPDRQTPVSALQTLIQFAADPELTQKIEELKNLLSNTLPENPNLADLFHEICDIALKHVTKEKKSTPAISVSGARLAHETKKSGSRNPSARTKNEVWKRDAGQCTYLDVRTNRRCKAKKNLQYDHLVPVAKGGSNRPENLRLLCRAHNQFAAIQEFGADHISKFVPNIRSD